MAQPHADTLYREIVKRLNGAAIVAGWKPTPDWQTAIDYLRQRAHQATACEGVLRDLALTLSVGGYNAPEVDAKVFHDKISDGIDMLTAPLVDLASQARADAIEETVKIVAREAEKLAQDEAGLRAAGRNGDAREPATYKDMLLRIVDAIRALSKDAPPKPDAIAAQVRIAELEQALRDMNCPRPCNHRPDDFTAGQCVDAGECGCVVGVILEGKS